ncbi:hypothetical protein GA707_17295 [Nostocoides sp. F2B08]|uniref:hypothetical protein n=1 Tax=Nostocoides sp. F2B08 TaxID=2653936 RepID=UPI001262EA6C|nr:hypothetical protein [Tetrasphaera sp. F2B08]KAB7741949.1 hypothetical protein GA707_17295 [Tetrasphaera sp. F2B08]
MPLRVRVLGLLLPALPALLAALAACSSGQIDPVESVESAESVEKVGSPTFTAELTQDSRDTARDRIAVVLANEGSAEVAPESIELVDPRLSRPLVADRLRAVPPGGERRFPLPLVDPVCGGPASDPVTGPGRLAVRVGEHTVDVPVRDEVGVVTRWVERRCAELDVAAVAELRFTDVRARDEGGSVAGADLVLTATPSGEGSGAYVIESVAGTPVFTAVGEPWAPGVTVSADGEPVDVVLAARPARCDGHVFGESAGATSFLVGIRLDGTPREVLVRMSPEVSAAALDLAIDVCRERL